jgi:gliding motility-associated-like protein
MKTCFTFILVLFISNLLQAQNSLVGDGFGGRKWYKPYNYTVGSYSAYAICGAAKQLYAWGSNNYGQLGDNSNTPKPKPVKVLGMDHVKYYSTGYVMGAIKEDSTGWMWGSFNSFNLSNAKAAKVINNVMFVDAGISNCAFVKYDGTVWSVGQNYIGEFGNGQASNPFSKTPSQMLNINNAVRTAQGYRNTTVLLKDGTLRIAGDYNGNNYTTPIQININAFIVDIKANTYNNIALDSTGDVWYWNLTDTPVKLSGLQNVVAISGCNDGLHFLFLDENHDCYAMGNNTFGQCGIMSTGTLTVPTLVASNVNDIMAGELFSYIVKSNADLYGSGTSSLGLIGSIWLNIADSQRFEFTKIDPTDSTINLCGIDNDGEYGEAIIPDPIIPQPILDTPIVFFPNVFSPNGDSKNDVFKAICADPSKVEKFDLRIFNRYGEQVFRTSAIDKGWDGKEHELSTYFYYCRYKQYNKNFLEAKGDFILLR